jgi:hypothetical protein
MRMRFMSKFSVMVIIIVLLFPSLLPQIVIGAGTTEVRAEPTSSKVIIDGQSVAFEAYEINGNNFFKLRDIAMALVGTPFQFDVMWDSNKNAINLISGTAYTPIGGERIVSSKRASHKAINTTSAIFIGDEPAMLTAYNIRENNYFKLRDLGQAIGFDVQFDSKLNAIVISTTETQKNISSSKKVVFKDKALEEVVRGLLNKPTGDLYENEVLQITSISINEIRRFSRK